MFVQGVQNEKDDTLDKLCYLMCSLVANYNTFSKNNWFF